MLLHRIYIDPRCREGRRDLADPYELHSTLCRAFSYPEEKCSPGNFLWRLERETRTIVYPRVLVQSRFMPNWQRIGVEGWLSRADPAVDLMDKLQVDAIRPGKQFRFRLKANPSVKRGGKRLGLLQVEEQENWIVRQGERHGFELPRLESLDIFDEQEDGIGVRISQAEMLRGTRRDGGEIRVFSVVYDGVLIVREPQKFRDALATGIGHGKVMGLGLLSVAPIAAG